MPRFYQDKKLIIVLQLVILLFSVIGLNLTQDPPIEIEQKDDSQFQINESIRNTVNSFQMGFIENRGQQSDHIDYFIRSSSISIGFSQSYIQFITTSGDYLAILKFQGSNLVKPVGVTPINSHQTFITGSENPENNLSFQTLLYQNLYNGIDLYYMLKDGKLKYEFYVHPGSDTEDIHLKWEGNVDIESTIDGMILNFGKVGNYPLKFLDTSPVNFDSEQRNKEIFGEFRIIDKNEYGFHIPDYNKDQLLIIDPTLLSMSTYVSGNDDEYGEDIAIDSSDNIYVVGSTKSTNFPTVNAYDSTADELSYTWDAFVFKLSSDGSTLIYSTYIGGLANDYAKSIVVDTSGNAYIAGFTGSSDFPVTSGVVNETKNPSNDIFILKLSSDGSTLIYSTYYGGSYDDEASGIAIDSSNNVYITGNTESSDFPTSVNAADPTGDESTSLTDVFVAKLNSDATSVLYSTYVSGSSYDNGNAIEVDSSGNAYITGITYSSDFPTSIGSYDSSLNGATDPFITKISADGTSFVFSTYLSIGASTEEGGDITIDSSGNVYVTGNYYTSGFMAMFTVKLDADGSTILSYKLMSAGGNTYGRGIVVDNEGSIYVTGFTYGDSFPVTVDAYNTTGISGNSDVVVFKLSPDMVTLNYSTYIPGSGEDLAYGIGLNSMGDVVITGRTTSTDFPVTSGIYNSTGDYTANYDVFVTTLDFDSEIVAPDLVKPHIVGVSSDTYELGSSGNTISWELSDTAPYNYNITMNNVLFGEPSNSWSTGSVSINVDDFDVGIYEFNITVSDESGNINSFITVLNVVDTISPTIDSVEDLTYVEGSSGNIITWVVDDLDPGFYNITLEGKLYVSTTSWSDTSISVNIDELMVGTYVLIINIYDASGNKATDSVNINVIEENNTGMQSDSPTPSPTNNTPSNNDLNSDRSDTSASFLRYSYLALVSLFIPIIFSKRKQ